MTLPYRLAVSICLVSAAAQGSPSQVGTSGIINMPDARVEADGMFGFGYSYDSPYSTVWTRLTMLPFLQVGGRFVGIRGTPGFSSSRYQESYGSYKDKVIDLKLQLLDEGRYWPALAVGKTDVFGTELFKGEYLALSKRIGSADFTVGMGNKRPEGVFGGVNWRLPIDSGAWTLKAEYDANNYGKDFRAKSTFAGQRKSGPVLGLEYRWGWLGAQIARSRTHSSANLFVDIPFAEKEYVPKIYEPASYASVRSRPDETAWRGDTSHQNGLIAALQKQDYKAVNVSYRRGVLYLDLSNTRINNVGRAVGRAVRTALYFTPLETRTIKVRYHKQDLPLVEYEFFELNRLADYLGHKITREVFRDFVLVKHAQPGVFMPDDDPDAIAKGLDEGVDIAMVSNEDGNSIQLRGQDAQLNRFSIAPKIGMYFNDPSGAMRYEINAQASSQLRLAPGSYLDSVLTYKLLEDISKVNNPSNSQLPHVRTDIAEYKRGNAFRLNQLTYTQMFQPEERLYGKFSAGIFEDMFAGVATQWVYFPRSSRWIAELTAEAVQQRDFNGWFGKRDYKTVSGLASLHYKLPNGITVTGRAGRFLAKDSGVRFEFKRRFNSGIEAGAWYTYTDGKDTTSPGTPSNPYQDRGLFMAIPFDNMLPADTQAGVRMSISPWTRDVGQVVDVPHNLIQKLEDPARQLALDDGMGNLAENPAESQSSNLPDPAWWPSASGIRMRLDNTLGATPEISDAAIATTLGVVAVGVASLRDKSVYQQVQKYKTNKVMTSWGKVGSAAPLVVMGAAGAAMALSDDPILVNTSIISLQAAALAAGVSIGAKQIVDRARPQDSNGSPWQKAKAGSSSFPSNHAAVTMAAITPFAEEYQLPWLYVAGGLASAGRVANSKHWVSDAVAGGLLGYGVGHWLWQGQRNTMVTPAISVSSKSIGLNLSHQY